MQTPSKIPQMKILLTEINHSVSFYFLFLLPVKFLFCFALFWLLSHTWLHSTISPGSQKSLLLADLEDHLGCHGSNPVGWGKANLLCFPFDSVSVNFYLSSFEIKLFLIRKKLHFELLWLLSFMLIFYHFMNWWFYLASIVLVTIRFSKNLVAWVLLYKNYFMLPYISPKVSFWEKEQAQFRNVLSFLL